MMCEFRGVALESVLPLRLTGGAFAVWSQLPADSRRSLTVVKNALHAAFALDQYAVGYNQVSRLTSFWLTYDASQYYLEVCLRVPWCVHLWLGCQKMFAAPFELDQELSD